VTSQGLKAYARVGLDGEGGLPFERISEVCNFFSFVTEPENNGGKRFYFNWNYRKDNLQAENDSHSTICKHFSLKEDVCNKYEFNPLTKNFKVDQINSPVDDRIQAEEWVNNLDFKNIVEPLIIKPIVNPFELPMVKKPTEEQIQLLKDWDSVWASVWDSVWASVWDSVGASVWDSVRDSVWAYISSFFDIKYKYDISPAVKLWEQGLIPSFDGTTWRLHSGKKTEIVYEYKP